MLSFLIPSLSFRLIIAFSLSLILSLLTGKICIKIFKNIKFVDYVREDAPYSHSQKRGIPTAGGVFIIFSFLISFLLFVNLANRWLIVALIVTLYLGILGFLDDWIKISKKSSRGLKIRYKLGLQFIFSFFIALYLYFSLEFNTQLFIPFTKVKLDIGWGYIPLIMAVIMGTSNSVNLTDGLDGLAVGCIIPAAFVYIVLAYLTYIPGGKELAIFLAICVGAGFGFLWYNHYPAKIFMGETGAEALGGALAISSILIKRELLLVLVGGVFVIEALSVFLQVASFQIRGKRIFKMSPLHHHYELKGMKESDIVIRFWIVSILLAVSGLIIGLFG